MACDSASSLSRACSTAGLPSGFLSIRWTMAWRIGMAVSWRAIRMRQCNRSVVRDRSRTVARAYPSDMLAFCLNGDCK
ncbi:hypothetical protein D3C75_1177800 [compost metagenome]